MWVLIHNGIEVNPRKKKCPWESLHHSLSITWYLRWVWVKPIDAKLGRKKYRFKNRGNALHTRNICVKLQLVLQIRRNLLDMLRLYQQKMARKLNAVMVFAMQRCLSNMSCCLQQSSGHMHSFKRFRSKNSYFSRQTKHLSNPYAFV